MLADLHAKAMEGQKAACLEVMAADEKVLVPPWPGMKRAAR